MFGRSISLGIPCRFTDSDFDLHSVHCYTSEYIFIVNPFPDDTTYRIFCFQIHKENLMDLLFKKGYTKIQNKRKILDFNKIKGLT